MTLAKLFAECHAKDIILAARNDRLDIDSPRDALTPELLARLKTHKAGLLALLERYEERAAIMEYDGGLTRPEAERLARLEVLESC